MLNWVFLFLVAGAVLTAAFGGSMKAVTDASLASARSAVELALGLIGQMGLWLGFMRILQDAGLMRSIARGLAPVMKRVFPDVPADHPAMGAMIMNMAANMLGLGNAATPFGLKAMIELNRLNTRPGVATNAMALFLAINTSGVAVLPLGVVAIRATLGSSDPAGIVVPSILASALNTIVAVFAAKGLERLGMFAPERYEAIGSAVETKPIAGMNEAEQVAAKVEPASLGARLTAWGIGIAVLVALGLQAWRLMNPESPDVLPLSGADTARTIFSDWLLPLLMLSIVLFGLSRRVRVYESFIAGAKESFQIAITIIPFLLAILVAIGMFRASGGMEALVLALAPLTSLIGLPAEALPMALIRPLSGSGAIAVMTETMKTYGPDSLVGYMVGVMNGTSETTFYVLALYFGSVQVRAIRHTLAACMTADVVGLLAAVWVTRWFFM